MKLFKISLALSLLYATNIYAAIDCNKYQLTTPETKICNTPDLRKLNNQIKQTEDAYIAEKQNKIEKFKKSQQKQIQLLNELSSEVSNTDIKNKLKEILRLISKQYDISFYTNDLAYLTQWLNQNSINKAAQCYDFTCFEKYLSQHLEQLKKYTSCENITIDSQCEIYIYDDMATPYQSASPEETKRKRKIRINKPNQCIYLFLSSSYSTEWDIFATPESKINAIIISGKDTQTVKNVPSNVQIFNHNSSQLLKNVTKCFYKNYTPDEILSKLKKEYEIDENNVSIIQSNIIGEIKEEPDYNVTSEAPKEENSQESASATGDAFILRQLLEQGKIKIMTAGDFQKAKKAGIIDARQPDFQVTDEHIVLSATPGNIFIVLEKGFSIPLKHITLFAPYDIAGNFLPLPSQNMYIIKATSDEVKTW